MKLLIFLLLIASTCYSQDSIVVKVPLGTSSGMTAVLNYLLKADSSTYTSRGYYRLKLDSIITALSSKGTSSFDGVYNSLTSKPDLTVYKLTSDSGRFSSQYVTAASAKKFIDSLVAVFTSGLSGKQATISTGSTSQYFKGDLSLGTFPTTTAPFSNSTDKNFVTDAKLAVVNNTSGTNTGDNSANSTYSSDYRAANFVAGTNYLAPNGNGSALTSLNGSNISSGTVPAAQLGSGSSITSKFLRGDNTWQAIAGGGDMLAANNLSDVSNAATARTNLGLVIGTNVLAPNGSGASLTSIPITAITGYTGYTLAVQALTSSPTDAQTIYFGNMPKAPTTTAATSKVYIRKAGTIKVAEIYCYSGTAGTNEAWAISIRLNNTTDTQIASLSVSTNERVFSNTGLSIAVSVGDYIEIKSVNPTWATNPLTTIFGGYIYIE